MRLTSANVGAKFIQKLVGAELVGIFGIEIRIQRIEVIAQNRFRRLHTAEHRHGPWERARSGVRIADI